MTNNVKQKLAKLLKEKGFNEMCRQFWGYDSTEEENILIGENSPTFINNRGNDDIAAPTIAEVIMYIYKKYGIWIYPRTKPLSGITKFEVEIEIPGKSGIWLTNDVNYYSSPSEGYEAGIEYTLLNLI